MSVCITHQWEVAYGLSIGTKINYLESTEAHAAASGSTLVTAVNY